jgi:hypothetical protein
LGSNWRSLVGVTGWLGKYYGSYPYPAEVVLVAELITPFVVGGLTIKWVVGFNQDGFRFGTYGFASLLDPSQMGGFFSYLGTTHFPYGRLVHPD